MEPTQCFGVGLYVEEDLGLETPDLSLNSDRTIVAKKLTRR